MIRSRAIYLLLSSVLPTTLAFTAACTDDLSNEHAATSALSGAGVFGGATYGGDDGEGGDSGGGIPPFQPPPPPFQVVLGVPLYGDNVNLNEIYHCEQAAHVGIAFSHDVVRGTVLYAYGVTVPHTKATFAIYHSSGGLVKTHVTDISHDNCVIAHEPETITTSDLIPGYYFIYASYWSMHPQRLHIPSFLEGFAVDNRGELIAAIRVR